MPSNELEVNTPEGAANALAAPPVPGATPAEAPQEMPTEVHEAPPTEVHDAVPTEAHEAVPMELQEAVPRLATGLELIGEFEGSGFKEPPYIARRADGQVVQMPQMLFALAEQIDGHTDVAGIAERFSHAIKRDVKPADVQLLIEKQLVPLGIVATGPDQESAELKKVDPLLALKFRAAVVPERAIRGLTTLFTPLFFGPLMALAVIAFLGLDGWLFFVHGISQSLRHVLYQPALMLMLIGGVVVATAFHEIGHATACRYGGARPGVMGVGVYIVWPAFYTDITDAYRLGKWGRLRTDLGGMYFNALFGLAMGAIYFATSFEPLLLLIVLQTFAIIQQALPLLRLDGYYILSDLTGVPDIYLRIRAVLASLLPGRKADPRVSELRGWVRAVVTLYVLLMVAFLGVAAVALIINLPRVIGTGYDSSALHFRAVGPDFHAGRPIKGALDVIQTLFLILPAAGLAFTAFRVIRRAGGRTLSWASGNPGRQTLVASGAALLVLLAAVSWWPSRGEYKPIQPGERGTLVGLIGQVKRLPTGHPSRPVRPTATSVSAPRSAGGKAAHPVRAGRRPASAGPQGGHGAPSTGAPPGQAPVFQTSRTAATSTATSSPTAQSSASTTATTTTTSDISTSSTASTVSSDTSSDTTTSTTNPTTTTTS